MHRVLVKWKETNKERGALRGKRNRSIKKKGRGVWGLEMTRREALGMRIELETELDGVCRLIKGF